MKTASITYCSRQKLADDGSLPARLRYSSPRIKAAEDYSKKERVEFLILSGLFGILEPDDPVPWYDHLLAEEEVAEMAKKIKPELDHYDKILLLAREGDWFDTYQKALELAAPGKVCLVYV